MHLSSHFLGVGAGASWLFAPDALTLFNFAALALFILLSLAAPRPWVRFVDKCWRALGRLASRKVLSLVAVFLFVVCLRVALLPVLPAPDPAVHDEFSYLLAADTFARGRLTNPPHPMWQHFESFHIIQQPTYASMYPPAQGLLLALGKLLTGRFWMGAFLGAALMCASLVWMLRGYMPARWALVGGLLMALRLGLTGYWVNSFWGGAVAATAGALLLGALPRIKRHARTRDALALASGVALLAASRPYEGFVLCVAAALALAVWLFARRRPTLGVVLKRVVVPASLVLAAAACALLFYFWRVTGDPVRMPYQVNRETYAVAKHFPWQEPRAEPVYRNVEMRTFYLQWEADAYKGARRGFARSAVVYVARSAWRVADAAGGYLLGPLLVWPLLFLPLVVLRDRRARFLAFACALTLTGLALEVWFSLHYAAPMTAALYGLSVQGLRHLHARRRGRLRHAGRLFARTLLILYALIFAAGLAARQSPYCVLPEWPWGICGRTSGEGRERARVLKFLESQEGGHVALVRYVPEHNIHDEWVYNEADIDGARVVWARDLGPEETDRLLEHFRARRVWIVEPDYSPARVYEYPR
ncbi:MAG TPA: hypothetical protein VFX96_13840 [Pyrinomonadaceae bacterium]|nr:hypothetical protein [Pyrinomonadaceae bacterium]